MSVHLYMSNIRQENRDGGGREQLILNAERSKPAFARPLPPASPPPPRQLVNKGLVQSANERPVGQDGKIWIASAVDALVEYWFW